LRKPPLAFIKEREKEVCVLKDFKAFIMRGNVVDLAIGVVIGAAFGAIVNSLVKDIIMPPIGLLLSGIDFSSLMVVLKEGATPGFLIIAAVVFFFIVRPMVKLNTAKKPAAAAAPAVPTTKECPYCASTIAIKATRCPHCTSELAR
jgi:large conductance mechanosensitive channel